MFMNYRAKEKWIKKHIIKNILKFFEQTKTLSKKRNPLASPRHSSRSWDRLSESHSLSQLTISTNDSHEEYGQLAARASDQYLSGRHVIMILLCCFDFSGRHIVPQVAVKSSCAQPAQKGRYLRTREGLMAYLDSPLFASYLRGNL